MRKETPWPTTILSGPLRRPKPNAVYGARIAEPRVTWAGARLAALWFGAPLIAALLAFDLVIWGVGELFFGACWAIWCLL